MSSRWNRHDRIEICLLLSVIALMHVLGFATLILLIAPRHFQAGSQIFGVGLGATAYLFGLRHAFDADHIAAIDNTTRKLMTDGSERCSAWGSTPPRRSRCWRWPAPAPLPAYPGMPSWCCRCCSRPV
jgi:high-affinity nickel permease